MKILSNNAEVRSSYLWKEKYEKVSDGAESDPKKSKMGWSRYDVISITDMGKHGLMEEIFDQLGFERIDTDRIKNIVISG